MRTKTHAGWGADQATALALEALGWLAGDDDRLGGLISGAGLDAAGLRARAADPEFLGFVLEWLMQDDAVAADFAQAHGLSPEDLRAARAALPGGDAPEWT
jgi:hypothetical protein